MWDQAPGPLHAESEMEEGGKEAGSERQGARSGWVSGLAGSRTWQTSFSMSVSPFHREENRDSQALPHIILHPTP